jgi:hypothetical protein
MSIATSNLTSGFIDLATYDEQEKYTYGGSESIAYFVREVRKSTWFTQVPVVLSKSSGQSGFGQQWSVSISRAGDYLLHTWLRVVLPSVTAATANGTTLGATGQVVNVLRWTRNLMHNLIQECSITFNDLVAARFDNFHLDFWSSFTVPSGKRNGYNVMIGNVNQLINPVAANPLILVGQGGVQTSTTAGTVGLQVLPSQVLNLPLPFFFTRDSGIALPTAALPYNEMRINFSFRNWTDLLIKDTYVPNPTYSGGAAPFAFTSAAATSVVPNATKADTTTTTTGAAGCWVSQPAQQSDLAVNANIDISNSCQVWANYAIVSNEERKKMACAPRDILIEQVQTAPLQSFNNQNPLNTSASSFMGIANGTQITPQFDIRFSHAVKVLFWAARNKANYAAWSNYTSDPQFPLGPHQSGNIGAQPGVSALFGVVDFTAGSDPVDNTSLIYENTQRLQNMGSDYFSLVNPWFHSPVIPLETGYHSYSYSLDYYNIDPMGSTNYGKLTNVSIVPFSSAAQNNSWYFNASNQAPGPAVPITAVATKYDFITTCVNNNIIRISGGALGLKNWKPKIGSCRKRYNSSFSGKQYKNCTLFTRVM